MTDKPPADETPIQKALRLKKAAQDARNTPSGARERPSKANAGAQAKPWMKK